MTWTDQTDAPASARAATLAPSLPPSERRVVNTLLADLSGVVDCTAQELAERAGVSRASVIRTAQTLGYDGYPQLRVALARELSLTAPSSGSDADSSTAIGMLRTSIDQFARSLPRMMAALTEETVTAFVQALDTAQRLVVVATGLSSPLGLDTAMRLSAAGRPAEFLTDTLAQQIAASQLEPGSVCLVLSGSGATQSSIEAAQAAQAAGATVLVVTSFARAPLVGYATHALVVPPVNESFSDELVHTSRAALALVLESLVEILVTLRGPRGRRARSLALSLIEKRISS